MTKRWPYTVASMKYSQNFECTEKDLHCSRSFLSPLILSLRLCYFHINQFFVDFQINHLVPQKSIFGLFITRLSSLSIYSLLLYISLPFFILLCHNWATLNKANRNITDDRRHTLLCSRTFLTHSCSCHSLELKDPLLEPLSVPEAKISPTWGIRAKRCFYAYIGFTVPEAEGPHVDGPRLRWCLRSPKLKNLVQHLYTFVFFPSIVCAE